MASCKLSNPRCQNMQQMERLRSQLLIDAYIVAYYSAIYIRSLLLHLFVCVCYSILFWSAVQMKADVNMFNNKLMFTIFKLHLYFLIQQISIAYKKSSVPQECLIIFTFWKKSIDLRKCIYDPDSLAICSFWELQCVVSADFIFTFIN